jgi:hypothetical protein
VTARADCRLATHDTGIPASYTFENATAEPIAMYFLDEEGNPRFYFWLRLGASGKQGGYAGNAWCMVDADSGAAFQAVVVTEPEQTFTIR